ncbi:unnamed protein product [Protopolystoma xenopodis]|uniref:Uncharacterized protein n=1 Tax=Protopolystoma xenopodis TaxID=117903 RepID=A0A448XA06_9PLAT|nr:unnamed protein product [Protopolystoma xenopodis]
MMGQTLSGLLDYIDQVSPYFLRPPALLCGPIHGRVLLNCPPPGHPELATRPDHIPPHLPLCFNELTSHSGLLSFYIPIYTN